MHGVSSHAVSVFEQRLFAALGLLALAICYREADVQSLLPLESEFRSLLHVAKPIVTPPLWIAAAIVLGWCLGADRCVPAASCARMSRFS